MNIWSKMCKMCMTTSAKSTQETNVLAENVISNSSKIFTQQALHKEVVCGPRQVPDQFDTGVPAPVHLTSQVSIQVPERCTIKMGRVDLDSSKNLAWQCKTKHVSYVSAILDEGGPLHLNVHVHCIILM